jgi:hypothetical protein
MKRFGKIHLSLLENGSVKTMPRQLIHKQQQKKYKSPPIFGWAQLGRNVTAATNKHATVEELIDALFLAYLPSFERME